MAWRRIAERHARNPNRFAKRAAIGIAIGGLVVSGGALEASACAVPPAFPADLELQRYYKKGSNARVDPEALKRQRDKTKTLRSFLRKTTSLADRAWQERREARRRSAGECALSWIKTWARDRAYLGGMPTKQSEYQRKWDLAGLALAYVKLRRFTSLDDHSVIAPWLRQIADAAVAFQTAPGRTRNNHLYWLGLALSATSLATDRQQDWVAAREIMREAAGQIKANGTLPLELARGRRALHYHVFALMPLIVMAELAAERGEDWYAFANGALHRLTAITVAGLVNTAIFDRLAGVEQERPVNARAGWAYLYNLRFAENRIPPQFTRKRDHRLLGGDVRTLSAALRDRQ